MNLADDLVKLSDLHRAGALSEAEFTAAKARLISGPSHHPSAGDLAQPCDAPSRPPEEPDRRWMRPMGWLTTGIGAAGFFASVWVNGDTKSEPAALLAGLFNPLFFVGVPLGLYWLARGGATAGGTLTAINNSTLTAEERQRAGQSRSPCTRRVDIPPSDSALIPLTRSGSFDSSAVSE